MTKQPTADEVAGRAANRDRLAVTRCGQLDERCLRCGDAKKEEHLDGCQALAVNRVQESL